MMSVASFPGRFDPLEVEGVADSDGVYRLLPRFDATTAGARTRVEFAVDGRRVTCLTGDRNSPYITLRAMHPLPRDRRSSFRLRYVAGVGNISVGFLPALRDDPRDADHVARRAWLRGTAAVAPGPPPPRHPQRQPSPSTTAGDTLDAASTGDDDATAGTTALPVGPGAAPARPIPATTAAAPPGITQQQQQQMRVAQAIAATLPPPVPALPGVHANASVKRMGTSSISILSGWSFNSRTPISPEDYARIWGPVTTTAAPGDPDRRTWFGDWTFDVTSVADGPPMLALGAVVEFDYDPIAQVVRVSCDGASAVGRLGDECLAEAGEEGPELYPAVSIWLAGQTVEFVDGPDA